MAKLSQKWTDEDYEREDECPPRDRLIIDFAEVKKWLIEHEDRLELIEEILREEERSKS